MDLEARLAGFTLPLTPERGAKLLARALKEVEGPALTPVEHALLVYLIERAECGEQLPQRTRYVLAGLLAKLYEL
jgi:hypothetical protein